jgi:hypothetical protein
MLELLARRSTAYLSQVATKRRNQQKKNKPDPPDMPPRATPPGWTTLRGIFTAP